MPAAITLVSYSSRLINQKQAGILREGRRRHDLKNVRHSRVVLAGIHNKQEHINTLRINKPLDARLKHAGMTTFEILDARLGQAGMTFTNSSMRRGKIVGCCEPIISISRKEQFRMSAAKKKTSTVKRAKKTSSAAGKSRKWVYLFSEVAQAEKYAKSWEGVRALLGGKGAGLADMNRGGLPVPPGFTVTTEACNAYLAAGEKFPSGMWDQEAGRPAPGGEDHRQEIRRSEESAARLLPLRRQVLHARHDGHGPQHRVERRDREGNDRPDQERKLRLRRLPPAGADVLLGGDECGEG